MRSAWRPTRPTVRRTVLGLALLLVLGVGTPVAWNWHQERQERCTEGVVKRGPSDECVGVTDGGDRDFAFAGHLRKVQRLIGKENARVERGEKDYATIAYMTSFTVAEDDSNSADSVRRALQGAYLAQKRANERDLSRSPKIRLLVANTGSGSRFWQHTVQQLVELSELKDEEKRLLAVVGLGPSTKRNKQALKELEKHGVAMVGSIMTADELAGIDGLVRVPPTNREQAKAAAAFLRDEGFREAVIVSDTAEKNLYATSLADEFEEAFPHGKHRLLGEPLQYDSSQRDAWEAQLFFSIGILCDRDPDVVYFAGRGKHLMTFINHLANRTCPEQEFTVMTGDDTSNLTVAELRKAAQRGVEVFYTGIAHPRMWQEKPTAVSKVSAGYFAEGGWMSEHFPSDPLDDGQAMVGHDATLTAVRAIRMAAEQGDRLTTSVVGAMFTQMHGTFRVRGASGFLAFHNNGNPVNKALPILELQPSGRFELRKVMHTGSRG